MLNAQNTLSRKIEELKPNDGKTLHMYVCGITPYDSSHLGHARTFVSFDIMRRWIEGGHKIKVNFIQNVTDIDDKIINRAKQKGILPLELSKKYDEQCRGEMKKLNIMPATVMPKISEHIPQTIAMIQKLMDAQIAYKTDTGIYYDVSKFADYGKLSGQNIDKIKSGARIEIDEKKKNPIDFALWKFSQEKGATYESPWGKGRPGWHIECSAMSMHHTNGTPLDLHCGARDLIFPHHENEIAQSQGAGYKPFSRMWIHTGFLTVNGEKMAKSLGNFITIEEALKKWDANSLRLFFAQTHYSSPVDFSEKSIEAAKNTLDNVKRSLTIMQGEGEKSDKDAEHTLMDLINSHMSKFASAMDNDFDTPSAISELVLATKEIARARAQNNISKEIIQEQIEIVKQKFEMLGFSFEQNKHTQMSKEQIDKLVAKREEARQNKDWATSDKIRDELAGNGVIIEDSKDGIRWRYA